MILGSGVIDAAIDKDTAAVDHRSAQAFRPAEQGQRHQPPP
jgi:hypothetical protein